MFADEDKIVTLYTHHAQTKEYTGDYEYYWAKGTGLAANSTLKKPPIYGEGFIPIFTDGELLVV